jgi:hypothetical protein
LSAAAFDGFVAGAATLSDAADAAAPVPLADAYFAVLLRL